MMICNILLNLAFCSILKLPRYKSDLNILISNELRERVDKGTEMRHSGGHVVAPGTLGARYTFLCLVEVPRHCAGATTIDNAVVCIQQGGR